MGFEFLDRWSAEGKNVCHVHIRSRGISGVSKFSIQLKDLCVPGGASNTVRLSLVVIMSVALSACVDSQPRPAPLSKPAVYEWAGSGPRPSAQRLGQDKSLCVQEAEQMEPNLMSDRWKARVHRCMKAKGWNERTPDKATKFEASMVSVFETELWVIPEPWSLSYVWPSAFCWYEGMPLSSACVYWQVASWHVTEPPSGTRRRL